MYSVTQRIRTVSQPRGGYLPVCSLEKRYYRDGNTIDTTSPFYQAYSSAQGTAVDYLTRFMCGFPAEKAFQVPIIGAMRVNDSDKAKALLETIKGLDFESIIAACKLTGYDVALRRGPQYYAGIDWISPDQTIVNNISIMVKRSMKFLQKHGKVKDAGFTFGDGYTSLVSSGDGDYLTSDGIWDFKTSLHEPNSAETLQILMYYAMSVHSNDSIFDHVEKIGIFNPLKNISYFAPVDNITDEIMATVCHDIIGYRISEEASSWRSSLGEDKEYINEIKEQKEREYTPTDFRSDCFEDGIHDISIDDYYTYLLHVSPDKERPRFPYTERVLFLKNSGFIMFISVSPSGGLSILHGGHIKKLDKPAQYYYDNLPKYANIVLSIFTPYWEFLERLGKNLRHIEPSIEMLQKEKYEKVKMIQQPTDRKLISFENYVSKHDWDYESAITRFDGKIHGCIVDLDYYNHVYVNPYDGTVTPYFAESMVSKYVYPNLASLIADKRPEMLPGFINWRADASALLSEEKSVQPESMELLLSDTISVNNELVCDTGMYSASRIMRGLQYTYDCNLVCDWYDDILHSKSLPRPEND